ncbi:P-loop containing nucleoside triphosphate hydrolase protein [Lophiotrema nucula]|uniref:ATP-dependent RNA helicase n=1 Tax=Lophiotrema nucula TaxID=690887 RepID=A0A6A5ZNV3_9PLEO|nr:P-loop containing nucleoside triphosphate hydrolase protein [Lophiotrema nucula]
MPALYGRWMPPKSTTKPHSAKTATSPKIDPHGQAEALEATQDLSSKAKPKKRKKELKEELKEQQYPVQEPSRPSKKPKKRKQDVQQDDAAQPDETTPKKHKKILDKFERSSKLGGALLTEELSEITHKEKVPDGLRDLVPIPQPEPVADAPFVPTFSTLPSWLADPITVESSKTALFKDLGVQSDFLRKLEKQGFKDALAVQTALLPMLHPGCGQHLGDICVSARTGSGKTLAYLLPMVEALSNRVVSSLSAIVVVPTRQLVEQALKVAEDLCTGTKLKVGTAVGNIALATEQKLLVKRRPQYDKARAQELHKRADQQWKTGFVERGGILEDLMEMPKDHIPSYESGVDILICTPGRLVEHIESTTGFLLRDVKWLVIDEADQLLDQEFQGWASTLIDALHGETPEDLMTVQERLAKLRLHSRWHIRPAAHRQVRKVILSATMKKDLNMLGILKFKRPKLVVVEDEDGTSRQEVNDGDAYELPSTLDEYAVAVGNGSDKPLYLLHVLLRHVFSDSRPTRPRKRLSTQSDSSANDPSSDLPSPEDSDSPDSESSSSGASPKAEDANTAVTQSNHRVLIFTKSNENASRLSHLVSTLHPLLKDYTKTLTRSSTSKSSKKLLDAFGKGKIKVLISSDLASRGLDIADLTHVINYDVPSGITSYVHRVGRTARAGKPGQAWTLFTKTEAAWFWKDIAKGSTVKRGGKKVHRITVYRDDVIEQRLEAYQEALQKLQGAVEGQE